MTMKCILFAGALLIAVSTSFAQTQQRGQVTTSRYSREALTNETALEWRTKLGVLAGTNGAATVDTIITTSNALRDFSISTTNNAASTNYVNTATNDVRSGLITIINTASNQNASATVAATNGLASIVQLNSSSNSVLTQAIGFTNGLARTNLSSASQSGLLSATDWSDFRSKQASNANVAAWSLFNTNQFIGTNAAANMSNGIVAQISGGGGTLDAGVTNQWRTDSTNAAAAVTNGYGNIVTKSVNDYQATNANLTDWAQFTTNQFLSTNSTALSVSNAASLGGMAAARFRTNELTYYNVLHWGLRNDAHELTNSTIAAGSQIITDSTANFSSANLGWSISVINANGLGTNLVSIITNIISSTSVGISNAATVGITNWQARYGVDIQYVWNAMMTNIDDAKKDAEVFVPVGKYMSSGEFFASNGSNWMQLWLPVQGVNDKKYSIWIHAETRPAGGGGVFQGNMPYTDSGAIFLFSRSPNHGPLDQMATNSCGIGYMNSVTGSGSFGLNNLNVTLENLVFRTWENQTMSPVGFDRMSYGRVKGCNFDDGWLTGRRVQNVFDTYGLRCPNGQNWPGVAVLDCDFSGYGSGFLVESDIVVDRCRSFLNNSIFTVGPAAYGKLTIPYLWASYCPTGMVTFKNFGPWPALDVSLDFEVGTTNAPGTPQWAQYQCLVYDPNNLACGKFVYHLTSNYSAWTNYGEGTTTIPDLFVGGNNDWFKPQRDADQATFRNGLYVGKYLRATNVIVGGITTSSNLMVAPSGATMRFGAVDIPGFAGISFDAVSTYEQNAMTRANCGIWAGTGATILQGPVVGFNSGSNVRAYIGAAGGFTVGTSSSDTLPVGNLVVDANVTVKGGSITNNGLVWFSLATNDVPSIDGPNGSICTTTNGATFQRTNDTWVLIGSSTGGGGASPTFSSQFSVSGGTTNIVDVSASTGTNMTLVSPTYIGDPGPWTPVALSNANLILRYRGDDLNGAVTDGGTVTNFNMFYGGAITNAGAVGVTLSSNLVNGHSAIAFNGASTAWLRTSNTVLTSALDRSMTVFAVLKITNSDSATFVRTFISSGATTFYGGIAGLGQVWRVNNLAPSTINTGYILDGGTNTTQTVIVSCRYNGTNFCSGNGLDYTAVGSAGTMSQSAQAYVGNFAAGTLNPFSGGILDVLVYKSALSDSDWELCAQQLMRDYGVSTNYARLIFTDVDSITYGFGINKGIEGWPDRLAQRYGRSARVWNSGVNSDSVANILSTEEVNYYKPPGQLSDYVLMGTTTDIAVDGKSAEACYAQIKTLMGRMGAKGFRTWVCETLPRQNSGATTFFETNRVHLNTYLSNSWPTIVSGGFVSFGDDAKLQDSTSTAYQSDQTHPSASGQQSVYARIYKALSGPGSGPNGDAGYFPNGITVGTNWSTAKLIDENGFVTTPVISALHYIFAGTNAAPADTNLVVWVAWTNGVTGEGYAFPAAKWP